MYCVCGSVLRSVFEKLAITIEYLIKWWINKLHQGEGIIPPLWCVKDPQSARSWATGYRCQAKLQRWCRVSMAPGAAGKQEGWSLQCMVKDQEKAQILSFWLCEGRDLWSHKQTSLSLTRKQWSITNWGQFYLPSKHWAMTAKETKQPCCSACGTLWLTQ